MADPKQKSCWLCSQCWQKRIIEVYGDMECLTDGNWMVDFCKLCNEVAGKHHIVSLPSELLNG